MDALDQPTFVCLMASLAVQPHLVIFLSRFLLLLGAEMDTYLILMEPFFRAQESLMTYHAIL
jgi:hypothetical protein